MQLLTSTALSRALGLTVLSLAGLIGCSDEDNPSLALGDPDVGQELIVEYGCGSCHQIPGITDAVGLVGPPLDQMGARKYIAGRLSNSPDNMVRWIMDPQNVEPGTAMPDVGLTEAQASDVAAYLYTLK